MAYKIRVYKKSPQGDLSDVTEKQALASVFAVALEYRAAAEMLKDALEAVNPNSDLIYKVVGDSAAGKLKAKYLDSFDLFVQSEVTARTITRENGLYICYFDDGSQLTFVIKATLTE